MQTNMEVKFDESLQAKVLAILALNGYDADDLEPHEVAASHGMTEEELDFELEKGMKCIEEGRVISSEKVWAKFGL